MKSDTDLEQIREARRLLSKECGTEVAAFIRGMMKYNEKYKAQIELFCKSTSIRHAESFFGCSMNNPPAAFV